MTPPASVRRFEQLWWASFVAWLGATILAWHRNQLILENDPRTIPVAALTQPVTVALVLVVTAAIWFPIARRASAAARWAAVAVAVLAGLRTLNLIVTVVGARSPHPLSSGLFVLATILDIAAVAMLFRRDTAAWFVPFNDQDLETVE